MNNRYPKTFLWFGIFVVVAIFVFMIVMRPQIISTDAGSSDIKFFYEGELFCKDSQVFRVESNPLKFVKIADLPKEITPACIKLFNGAVFVSDAFKKRVYAFDLSGKKIWESRGKDKFIIPSESFPIDISAEGKLWVANNGLHRLEELDMKSGEFVASWEASKNTPLKGCCNPTAFAVLPNGRFVLMQKGIFEIWIYEPSGDGKRLGAISQSWQKYKIRFDEKASKIEYFDGKSVKELSIQEL